MIAYAISKSEAFSISPAGIVNKRALIKVIKCSNSVAFNSFLEKVSGITKIK